MSIAELRAAYHRAICEQIIRISRGSTGLEYPNFADGSNRSSRDISWNLVKRLGYSDAGSSLRGQTAGGRFEAATARFLKDAFCLLHHLRPGRWYYSTTTAISEFAQYQHLAQLEKLLEGIQALKSSLGTDYIITPDIVVADGRFPTPRSIRTSRYCPSQSRFAL